mgnify:CR=1 FL=1
MKGVYALTEEIKKKTWKKRKLSRTTEEVVEEVSEPSELEEAQARAEEFENKYLRAHAEMQNIQRRANEERQQLQKYRSQDLAKAILPSLDNLERALAVEGLTDECQKRFGNGARKLVHALKEEGIEEIPADGDFDHNFHMAIQTMPADDEHPADTIAQVFQKGYKLHERVLRPVWWLFIIRKELNGR